MGIISGLGSFRGQFGDHFRVGDHFGVGIISGAVQIFTLAQKLKFQKTCQNPLQKLFRVVLCKKTLQKPRNVREMRAF